MSSLTDEDTDIIKSTAVVVDVVKDPCGSSIVKFKCVVRKGPAQLPTIEEIRLYIPGNTLAPLDEVRVKRHKVDMVEVGLEIQWEHGRLPREQNQW